MYTYYLHESWKSQTINLKWITRRTWNATIPPMIPCCKRQSLFSVCSAIWLIFLISWRWSCCELGGGMRNRLWNIFFRLFTITPGLKVYKIQPSNVDWSAICVRLLSTREVEVQLLHKQACACGTPSFGTDRSNKYCFRLFSCAWVQPLRELPVNQGSRWRNAGHSRYS